jgi:hypothetical protein
MHHDTTRQLLERCIDDKLNPLAEKIARERNLAVEDVLRALDGFKQHAIEQLLEAESKKGKLTDNDAQIIIATVFDEYFNSHTQQ